MARKREAPDHRRRGVVAAIRSAAAGAQRELATIARALGDEVALPVMGHVLDLPVKVLGFEWDGNERRGITVRCQRGDGATHYALGLGDVQFAEGTPVDRLAAAYRAWLDAGAKPSARTGRRSEELERVAQTDGPLDLAVLGAKQRAVRCLALPSRTVVTLRPSEEDLFVPGAILTVVPRKEWRYGKLHYISGVVTGQRLDPRALGLTPLRLESVGTWDPGEHYWGERDEPLEDWCKPIIAKGPRPEFEFESVLPGADLDDIDTDPILEAVESKDAGDFEGGRQLLMELTMADLRCLDAHAHLGNFCFDLDPELALRHYEVGFRVGELSLEGGLEGFRGVLHWGHVDNRPFLRCLHGYGLCLWQLGRSEEAARVFERLLWLNPTDNQGVRLVLPEVRAGGAWRP